jgi:hypothetical protein
MSTLVIQPVSSGIIVDGLLRGRAMARDRLALYAIAEHLTLDLAWHDDGTLELTLHEPTHTAALTIIGTP